MGKLETQLKRAESLSPSAITVALFTYLDSIEPYIVSLNRAQLFQASEDIFGNPLGYYSKATEYITTNAALLGQNVKIKKEGDPYDFLQTGTFLGGLYAKASGTFISFGSIDPKLDEILSNVRLLSKSFFGLTEKNKKALIDEKITPFLLLYLRKKLSV
jgi:hypothetical protein